MFIIEQEPSLPNSKYLTEFVKSVLCIGYCSQLTMSLVLVYIDLVLASRLVQILNSTNTVNNSCLCMVVRAHVGQLHI